MPTNPTTLVAGSALAGALWGFWRGRAEARSRQAVPELAESGRDDEPAS